jgi:uncharacterized protein YegP (UPF0339 family)
LLGFPGTFRLNATVPLIATSEAYEAKASALKGIESVSATPRPPRSTTNQR